MLGRNQPDDERKTVSQASFYSQLWLLLAVATLIQNITVLAALLYSAHSDTLWAGLCALPPTRLTNRIPALSLCIHEPVHELLNPAHHIFIYKAINQFIDYPSIGNITTDYDQGCISEHTTLPPPPGHPSCLCLLKLQRNGTYGRIHFRHGKPQLPAIPAAHAEKSAALIFTTKEQNSGSAFISPLRLFTKCLHNPLPYPTSIHVVCI